MKWSAQTIDWVHQRLVRTTFFLEWTRIFLVRTRISLVRTRIFLEHMRIFVEQTRILLVCRPKMKDSLSLVVRWSGDGPMKSKQLVGFEITGILYRWKLWLLCGRRSGEQRAKDGRYEATVGLRSVAKGTSSEQSGDCRSIVARCSATLRCPLGVPMKSTESKSIVARWLVDSRSAQYRSPNQKISVKKL